MLLEGTTTAGVIEITGADLSASLEPTVMVIESLGSVRPRVRTGGVVSTVTVMLPEVPTLGGLARS
jgi:hypothetical protein